MNSDILNEIYELKNKRNAVIVAHSYQSDEIQELADIVGDSFALSKYCAEVNKETIVFCGVHFMAESAKILSPKKTVLLPDRDAGCPMADMVTEKELEAKKKEYPDAKVVCYINSSAEVKALSDICCTSSNAINVVKSIKEKQILFVPDQNLGKYVAKFVPEKEFIFWQGYCPTHHRVKKEDVLKARKIHADALVLVHPECREEVIELADYVGSTKQIIDYAKNSPESKYIIGTEMGVLYQLQKDSPNKRFYLLSQGLICPNMKKTNLVSVREALLKNKFNIELDENIINRAKTSLLKMLNVK